jgi:hypothetical protein
MNSYPIVLKYSLIILSLFALYCSILIGFSWDEYFHHINGLVRYNFLISLGEFEKYNFRNNQFYPGLYDTLSYAFGQIFYFFDKRFYVENLDKLMHFFNATFALLGVLGLFIFTKKIFNKNIAYISAFLTLLNPFFFGHIGMNSKDIIIFFSLIWFCNYFYSYCVDENKKIKNIILASVFVGFGCGVRLTFLITILPCVIIGLVFLIQKYRSNYLNLFKRLIAHILISLLIVVFLIIICWPHMIVEIKNDNFINFFSIIVKNTINWNDGPKIGLINGSYYEVFNTPKTYFIDIILYRYPIYASLLLVTSYFLFFTKRLNSSLIIENFNQKFLGVNIIGFFSIFIAIILGVNIYDNLRLFLFTIPFISLISSFALEYLFKTFYTSKKIKLYSLVLLFLFSLSLYRFLTLTPYQYAYVNYSSPVFKNTIGKWEHDYWGASYKELIQKIKQTLSPDEIKKLRIAECGGGIWTLVYYTKKELGINRIYNSDNDLDKATHIIMNNRTYLDVFNNGYVKDLVNEKGEMLLRDMEKVVRSPNVKQKCFEYEKFDGINVVEVNRSGVPMTVLRKLNN